MIAIGSTMLLDDNIMVKIINIKHLTRYALVEFDTKKTSWVIFERLSYL